jgi:plastocyanin
MQRVSQRHRAFNPITLEISRDEAIEIVNDDGELTHHAYVKSAEFSFDSGEQEPGGKVDIVFPVVGSFTVLCGIHPRMHLDVTVK